MKNIMVKRIALAVGSTILSMSGLALQAETEFEKRSVPAGNWYGEDVYFGCHYDMHANQGDKGLGAALSTEYLTEILALARADLLQTDTKGHEGLVSWYSQTPTASVAPGIAKEMVEYWVDAGTRLGVPVQAHYSGIFDQAAGEKFPDWNAVDGSGNPIAGKMCPRGPYVDELLIPQARELADRGIAALWTDGEIWAVEPCYCERCSAEFKAESGYEPPRSMEDENWTKWIGFTRDSFEEYVAHYTTEIRRRAPAMRVCSNWLHSFRNPGRPWVPTDFLSGDNLGTLTHPNNAVNSRFMSTRKRPWEIVIWGFYYNEKSPWVMKSLDMLKQQAAQIIALGGHVSVYNQPKGHRDGRLVDWQMRRIGELSDFVKSRKEYCENSRVLPNAVILHSEHDFYSQKSRNIWEYETRHLEGALAALIDNSIPADIMDEWALLERIDDFPLLVAPSQENMSPAAVEALRNYVRRGGRLLLTGTEIYDTLGSDFLGVESVAVNAEHSYHVPAGGERVPLSSHGHQGAAWTESKIFPWREVRPTSARGILPLTTSLFDEDASDYYGATINQVGDGYVAYIPGDIMSYYYNSRYSVMRNFINEVIMAMKPSLAVQIEAPVAVETILRQKGKTKYLHMINRASGLPVFENTRGTEGIPRLGPITLEIPLSTQPASVELLFEDSPFEWEFVEGDEGAQGRLMVTIPSIHIHAILAVE